MTATNSDTISAARDAWQRIERGATFDDWVTVAKALAIGRAHAMATAETNKPFGRRFVAVISAWLREHGLDRITGQERHRALWVHDRLAEIEAWRATLPEERRRRLNHPSAVWAHYRRATASSSAPQPHATQRKIAKLGISQDQIARASDAIYALLKLGNADALVLARAALMAATKMPPRLRERRRPLAFEAQVAT